ncbi:hypothetical protein KCP77_24925 (plasmid) [Salmonella enterica subsp. enterica]|nr:hypothetical protein KCP77_24925 [Salmonella enterica subsp. enterica]
MGDKAITVLHGSARFKDNRNLIIATQRRRRARGGIRPCLIAAARARPCRRFPGLKRHSVLDFH